MIRKFTVYAGEIVGLISPVADVIEEISESIDQNDANIPEPKSDSRNLNKVSTSHEWNQPANIESIPDHLKELFDRATKNKDDWMKNELAKLLIDYKETFSRDEFDLGCTHLATHEIDTGDTKPIKLPPRRVPLALQGKDKEALDKMLKSGAIRNSTSPWAAPIVLVRKKSGDVRVCIDYRRVNAVTRRDAFALPKISDCLDTVSASKYFSTLDLTSGYNQIPVAEKDIPKTAFVTRHGFYECPKLSFGLCNAPATFQRVMELALQGLQWLTCLVYIDDILVFGPSFESHMIRLRQVLERLKQANLKVKPDKCQL